MLAASSGWPNRLWSAGVIVLLAVVGLSRTYRGAHYATDVLGGYLVGGLWALLVGIVGHYTWRLPRARAACAP